MPVLRKIIPAKGREFWDSLDPDNMKQLLETVKEEFSRSEPAYQLHYLASGPSHVPVSLFCFRHCQIFLLRGAFIIEGQGRVTETGCSYLVKDEDWIGLCACTTVVVMEEGERDTCLRQMQEWRERTLVQMQSPRALKKNWEFGRRRRYPQCTPS